MKPQNGYRRYLPYPEKILSNPYAADPEREVSGLENLLVEPKIHLLDRYRARKFILDEHHGDIDAARTDIDEAVHALGLPETFEFKSKAAPRYVKNRKFGYFVLLKATNATVSNIAAERVALHEELGLTIDNPKARSNLTMTKVTSLQHISPIFSHLVNVHTSQNPLLEFGVAERIE